MYMLLFRDLRWIVRMAVLRLAIAIAQGVCRGYLGVLLESSVVKSVTVCSVDIADSKTTPPRPLTLQKGAREA